MKCDCSANNNYEVIGLCNIKKFNEKIQDLSDESWSQIIIPSILTLPNSSPDIQYITKVYVDIKITSTKIITTPFSTVPNIEGMTLTGKILSVFGHICQKIVYVSTLSSQTLHYVNFTIDFNTYITIDEDANDDDHSYCVFPCLENVFVTPLNKRCINQSTKLFLFAHKVIKVPIFLPNEIIINSINDEKVAKIQFSVDTQKFVISSTSTIPNPALGDAIYFRLTLYDEFGDDIAQDSFKANETATEFKRFLNKVRFDYGYTIKITFIAAQVNKIIITNYPNSQTPIYNPTRLPEYFTITPDGLIPHIFPSEIIIDNDSSEMAKINFDYANRPRLFKVTNTQEIAPNEFNIQQEYFSFIFLDETFRRPFNASINGTQNAQSLTARFNNTTIFPDRFIKLRYKKPENIIITNYDNQEEYSPNGRFEFFKVTETKLEPFTPVFLPNTIRFKNQDGTIVLNIKFLKDAKMLLFDSTGIVNADSQFIVSLFDDSRNRVFEENLTIGSPADPIILPRDNTPFEFSYVIAIGYQDNLLVEVTNFPDSRTPVYIPSGVVQHFLITEDGLRALRPAPYINEIILKPLSTNLGKVNIDFNNKVLNVTSTGTSMPTGKNNLEYLSLSLFTSTLIKTKQGFVDGSSNADTTFRNELNNRAIEEGGLIKLRSKLPGFIITNYKGNPIYQVNTPFEFMTITSNGLVPFETEFLPNTIFLRNQDNSLIVSIQFISNIKILNIIPTEVENINSTFTIKLLNEQKQEILSRTVSPGDFGDNLLHFDFLSFEYNYILTIESSIPSLVDITNFPNQGSPLYHPTRQSENFRITPSGLIDETSSINKIIISNTSATMSEITFNTQSNRLSVTNTGALAPSKYNISQEYFGCILLDSAFNFLKEGSIRGTEGASNLVNQLNNESLITDRIIKLRYKEDTNLVLENYKGQAIYKPKNRFEFLKVATNPLRLEPFPITFLNNIIKLKNLDNAYVFNIQFSLNTPLIIFDPTGIINKMSTFAFRLFASDGTTQKLLATVLNNQTGDSSLSGFDNEQFEFNDIIEINCNVPSSIEITNLQGTPIYTPSSNTERYRITQAGLVKL